MAGETGDKLEMQRKHYLPLTIYAQLYCYTDQGSSRQAAGVRQVAGRLRTGRWWRWEMAGRVGVATWEGSLRSIPSI